MRHHFRDDTRGFGISAPYWDELFGASIARRTTAGTAGNGQPGRLNSTRRSDTRPSTPMTGTGTPADHDLPPKSSMPTARVPVPYPAPMHVRPPRPTTPTAGPERHPRGTHESLETLLARILTL
ncbi:hypothetical protein SMICM304S_11254 [Streptomyces microflavus]